MATKGSGSGGSGKPFDKKKSDELYTKHSKEITGAIEGANKKALDDTSKIARELLGKSNSFTIKGLVSSVVGDTVKGLQEVQDDYAKKLKKLAKQRDDIAKAYNENATEKLASKLEDIEEKLEDIKDYAEADRKDLMDTLEKQKVSIAADIALAGQLQGTGIGKLLEKNSKKKAAQEFVDKKKEFLANRKSLLEGLENQRKVADKIGDKELLAGINAQMKAARDKDFAAFDKIGESVEKHIDGLDSKLAKSALEQAKEAKTLSQRIAGKARGYLGDKVAGAGDAIKGQFARVGFGKYNLATLAGGLKGMADRRGALKAIDKSAASGPAELATMAEAEVKRQELFALTKIGKTLEGLKDAKDGASDGLIKTAGTIATALLGGAGGLAAIKSLVAPKGSIPPPTVDPVTGKPTAPVDPSKAAPKGGLMSKLGKFAGKALGPVLALGVGAYEAYGHKKDYDEGKTTEKERNAGYGSAAGGAGGALAGAAIGATLGSVVPVVGTAIGGVVGGIAGYLGGEKAGSALGGSVGSDSKKSAAPAAAATSVSSSPGAATKPSSGGSLPSGSDGASSGGGAAPAQGGSLSDLISTGSNVDLANLSPYTKNKLTSLAQDYYAKTGKKLKVNSAARSYAKQKQLYDDWVARKPGANPANKPGSSLHEIGYAVDIDPSQVDEMKSMGMLARNGFEGISHPKERQHIQIAGGAKAVESAGSGLSSGDTLGAPDVAVASKNPDSVDVSAGDNAKGVASTPAAISVASASSGDASSGGGSNSSSPNGGSSSASGGRGQSSSGGSPSNEAITTASIPTFAYNDPAFYAMNVSAMA